MKSTCKRKGFGPLLGLALLFRCQGETGECGLRARKSCLVRGAEIRIFAILLLFPWSSGGFRLEFVVVPNRAAHPHRIPDIVTPHNSKKHISAPDRTETDQRMHGIRVVLPESTTPPNEAKLSVSGTGSPRFPQRRADASQGPGQIMLAGRRSDSVFRPAGPSTSSSRSVETFPFSAEGLELGSGWIKVMKVMTARRSPV
jgi:hypothetical protein